MKCTAWKLARLAALTAATFAVSHPVALPQANACAVCKTETDCGPMPEDGSTKCEYDTSTQKCKEIGDPCYYVEG